MTKAKLIVLLLIVANMDIIYGVWLNLVGAQ